MESTRNFGRPPTISSEDNEGNGLLPKLTVKNKKRFISTYQIKTLKIRWVMVLVMFLINTANGWGWLAHTAVLFQTWKYYNVSEIHISLLPLEYFLMTCILILPATYIINNNGFRSTITSVAFVQMLGAFLKIIASTIYFKNYSYYVLAIGQFFYACSSPFITALPTKLADTCFSEGERPLANNIGSLGNLVGVMLANVLVPHIVSKIGYSYYVEIISSSPAIFGFLFCVIFFFHGELKDSVNSHLNFMKDVIMLLKIRTFTKLTLCFGVSIGGFGSLLALFMPITKYQGYEDNMYGVALALMILIGVMCSSGICYLIGKFGDPFKYIRAAQPALVIMLCVMTCLTRLHVNYYAFVFGLCLFSSISVALLPLYLVTGVEISRPLPAGLCAGFMLLCGQSFSLILSVIMTVILNKFDAHKGPAIALVVLIVPLTISSIFFIVWFRKQPLSYKETICSN